MTEERMELKQIEANVVIVLENKAGDGQVIPLWECEIPPKKLNEKAANLALDFAEELGSGAVYFTIFDYRSLT